MAAAHARPMNERRNRGNPDLAARGRAHATTSGLHDWARDRAGALHHDEPAERQAGASRAAL